MVIRAENRQERIWEGMRDGPGQAQLLSIIGPEQLGGMGKLYSVITLEPGCGVGLHKHEGDCETYFILSGEGELNDNGTITTLRAGDVSFTDSGEQHAIVNKGMSPAEAVHALMTRDLKREV